MLKQLIALWRDNGIMQGVLRQLGEMVADAHYVHQTAWELAQGPADADSTKLKQRDKGINQRERDIRKLLLEHLVVNPQQDVSGCLAVMSLAKDLERLGDLAKSLHTISRKSGHALSELPHFDQYEALHTAIGEQFPRLRLAVIESDEAVARQVIAHYQQIKTQSKALSKGIYDAEMPSKVAITAALIAHTLGRENSHQGNAATAIIFPLENIDYVSRGLRQEADE